MAWVVTEPARGRDDLDGRRMDDAVAPDRGTSVDMITVVARSLASVTRNVARSWRRSP